ncbi:LacI family DNA-binding transcriptional regulator [Reyranella sp.]|uniref:LacI family DNA-binding transcriptional regulator n=1 Tax=Reyranella sp. TaxID=1929291 RepID=UPI003783BE2A
MVSVVAVAQRAGVSPATVSRVLGGRVPVTPETRARVLEAIDQLGYRPNEVARTLRAGRGRSVALVIGDVEQGINAALAKNVQRELERQGLDLLLFDLGHREDRLRHILERAPSLGLRGLLLSSPHVMDMQALAPAIQAATERGIDILSVSQDLSEHGIPSIVHDDAGGGTAAVTHLVNQLRTPVAFVGRIATSAVGRARFEGYRDALLAHGQPVDPSLVWDISEGFRADAGYRAASDALDRGLRFRSILAASDELALGCMAAATDRGLSIPGDIAFVGFGGLGIGAFARPAMSTVVLDVEAVARTVRAFFEAGPGRAGPVRRHLIPTKLVQRQSA